jgi:hypothetical protein
MPSQYSQTKRATRTHSTFNVTHNLPHLICLHIYSRNLIRPSVGYLLRPFVLSNKTHPYHQFETSLWMISQSFALQSVNPLVSSSNLTLLLFTSPQTAITPIWYTINNLVPFNVPVYDFLYHPFFLFGLIIRVQCIGSNFRWFDLRTDTLILRCCNYVFLFLIYIFPFMHHR